MDTKSFFSDKSLSAKQKTSELSEIIADRPEILPELIHYASEGKDAEKATILEAFEYVSKKNPEIITAEVFDFVRHQLHSKSSRVKWESGKIIGNSISLYPEMVEEITPTLLENTRDESTVVRWSMAYALAEILKLRLSINETLVPKISETMKMEQKNSILKIYQQALKQVKE